ncbi:MAG: DUF1538 domain-containing protein [Myxococcota bacterium]
MGGALEPVRILGETVRDVLPIAAILSVFQLFVLRQPLPNPRQLALGFGYVLAGLVLFLLGLELAIFPIGKTMAAQLTAPELLGARAGESSAAAYFWVYVFAFAVGFSTTLAEPALIAVALKAESLSADAVSARGLRIAVALGVGFGIALGAYRIVIGVPIHHFIVVGYAVVIAQTLFAPKLIVPLAYDSGGVTTSTITVPLVAALGLGLAEAIPGRSPLIDGFGLIAFASLFPMMSVMAYAQFSVWWAGAGDAADDGVGSMEAGEDRT